MKKILLVALIALSGFAAPCEKSYQDLQTELRKFSKLYKAQMVHEYTASMVMLDKYSLDVVVACPEDSKAYLIAKEVRSNLQK